MSHAAAVVLSPVTPLDLSPESAPLSTLLVGQMQLRDIRFVSRASTRGYITTGVETRSLIECAPTPAGPALETESRVSRRRRPRYAKHDQ